MKTDSRKATMTTHPLVHSYLTSLARALGETEDHDEVLESVREHIAEALSMQADPMDGKTVQKVLEELGPIERIIATQAEPPAAAQPPTRSWALISVGIFAVASLALVLVIPFVAIPLALGCLAIGVVAATQQAPRRKRAGWICIIVISALTLTIALFGALFFLTLGTTTVVPGSPAPAESTSVGG